MKTFQGKTLSWRVVEGTIELTLDHAPCNEIGLAVLAELEQFVGALGKLKDDAHALIISSARTEGFCAGGDLRELFHLSQELPAAQRLSGLRDFIERVHAGVNGLDGGP